MSMTEWERFEISDEPPQPSIAGDDDGPYDGSDDDEDGRALLSASPRDDVARDGARSSEVRRRLWTLTALAAIGGFLFGYDTGVVSGAMPAIVRRFALSPPQEEAVVSSTVLAAFASSLVGGTVSRRSGRRVAILCASSVFAIGAVQMGLAWSYRSLVLGRLIVGGGIGLASLSTPIYLAEVAPPAMRGTLVTINGMMICFGQFSAGMVDGVLNGMSPSEGWRGMLGLAAVPSVVMFVGFLFMPESPRWLVMQGRHDEALSVLHKIRETSQEASDELQEIVDCSVVAGRDSADAEAYLDDAFEYGEESDLGCGEEEPTARAPPVAASARGAGPSLVGQAREMLAHAPTRRALKLGCGMMVLQQLSGINTVMYYAASIYEMSGFDGTSE